MSTPTRALTEERDTNWRLSAACRVADPELFAPISRRSPIPPPRAVKAGQTYCSTCPVQRRCRTWADEQGVGALGLWGRQWRHAHDVRGRVVVTDIPPKPGPKPTAPRQLPPLTDEHQAVLDAVGDEPTATSTLIEVTGLDRGRVRKTLEVLVRRELVRSPRWGFWCRTAEQTAEAA